MDTLLGVLEEARSQRNETSARHFPFNVNIYIRDSASGLYIRIYVDDGTLVRKPVGVDTCKNTYTTLLSFSCSKDKVHHEHGILTLPKNCKNYMKVHYGVYIFGSRAILGPIVENYTPVYFSPAPEIEYIDKIIYSAKLPVDTTQIYLVDDI